MVGGLQTSSTNLALPQLFSHCQGIKSIYTLMQSLCYYLLNRSAGGLLGLLPLLPTVGFQYCPFAASSYDVKS